ncbi:hypothetical protein [Actinomadura sp. HBU206391]|uniref:hypothetical protein n=1 Tax=Actinomadura sp. HBU206391 TaxID=2731692 RepID=UPI00165014CF|nr:hypothetical protein [Actinomadura sp. HBU206391]MBC6461047.1 hypothetical protein [Actinomadura sp. HBU206391]
MVTGDDDEPDPSRGSWEGFVSLLTERAIWKLLVKGLEVFVPGSSVTIGSVRFAERASMIGAGVFHSADSGFGLSLRARAARSEPQREIYVRGRDVRSIGVVITGEATAAGTRVLDATGLLRYARRLTFESLFAVADEGSVVPAVRAARAVENVVLLDPGAGIGLCVEVDPVTGTVNCPLFVRFADRSSGAVHAYASGDWAAQAVRSQT